MAGLKVKIYQTGSEVLIAACDADLIGKTLRDGELRLVVGSFYNGDVMDEDRFLSHLRLATMGNLVGSETIRIAKEAGFVQDDGVILIAGVPHAQFYTL